MEGFNRNKSDIFTIEVDETAKSSFIEMARWTKFLAILGFVFMGLMLVGGLITVVVLSDGQSLGGIPGSYAKGVIAGYIALMVGIGYYPVWALFKYSGCIKLALANNDKHQFNKALAYLKNMFKYHGIIAIVILALYGIIIIFSMLSALGR